MIDWLSPLRGPFLGLSDRKLKLGPCAFCGKSENYTGLISRVPCEKCGKVVCWECADCGVYGSLSDFQSFVLRRTDGGKDVYLRAENCRNCQETTWWKKYASTPPSLLQSEGNLQHNANQSHIPPKTLGVYPVNPNNLEEVQFLWSEVRNEAEDILNGQTGILEGVRELAYLSQRLAPVKTDADFSVFIALDSETDHLPVGEERKNWAASALSEKDEEIRRFENLYRERVFAACRELIKKRV
jgi:hypothetical protein